MKRPCNQHNATKVTGDFANFIKLTNGDSRFKFDQKVLISNLLTHASYDSKNILQHSDGVCAGLLFTWYEYLVNNSNLLDESVLVPSETALINKILKAQEAFGTSLGCISLLREAMSQEPFLLANQFIKVMEKTITSDKGSSFTKEIKKYMNDMHENEADVEGLHTITFIKPGSNQGHIFGWTKVNKPQVGYLLFDANKGELFFSDFNLCIDAITHNLSNSEGGVCTDRLDISYSSYYTQADINKLSPEAQIYVNNAHEAFIDNYKITILNILSDKLNALCLSAIEHLSNSMFCYGEDKKRKLETLSRAITSNTQSENDIILHARNLINITKKPRGLSLFNSAPKSFNFVVSELCNNKKYAHIALLLRSQKLEISQTDLRLT